MQDVYELLGINSSASADEVRAALGRHREMYSMVVNSPDRELATRAEVMLKKLDAAEEKLGVPQHVDASKRTEVSHASESGDSLSQDLSRCVAFFRQGQVAEANELLDGLETTHPDEPIRTKIARRLLDDARTYITYAGDRAYIENSESLAHVEGRLNDVRSLNVQDPRIPIAAKSIDRLVQSAKGTQAPEQAPEQVNDRGGTNPVAGRLGCLGAVAVIVAALFGMEFLLNAFSGNDDGEVTDADKVRAVQNCESAVKNQLKAPSTAKFSNESFQYNPNDELDYQVVLTVDAQNSFGAMLQTEYACQMRWKPSTESWDMQSVFQR